MLRRPSPTRKRHGRTRRRTGGNAKHPLHTGGSRRPVPGIHSEGSQTVTVPDQAPRPTHRAALLACALTLTVPLAAQERVELPAGDTFLDPAFEEVYRVGGMDGADWEAFGFVSEAGFDGAGNLYVLDGSNARVVVVSPDGGLVREFGRRGDGPGEFGAAEALAVTRDGSAVVFDPSKLGFQVFGPGGEFVRASSMRREAEGPLSLVRINDGMRVAGSGEMVIARGFRKIDVTRSQAPPDERRHVVRFDIGRDQVRMDTLAAAWMPRKDDSGVRVSGSASRPTVEIRRNLRAFEPGLLVAVMPGGGFAYSDSTTYAIRVADASGVVSRVLARPVQPRPVTDRIRDAERERRMAAIPAGGGLSSRQLDEIRQGMAANLEFYPEVPALSDVRASWEGRLWVRRWSADASPDGPIDVLSAGGGYAGTFAEGAAAMPIAFGPGGLAAFAETNDLDVQTIVVKRLPQGVR